MPDFDGANPPKKATDPTNIATGAPFPRHLFKFAPEASDTSLIVAWKAKAAIHNEFRVVGSDAEQDAAIADGFALAPVLAPVLDVPAVADAPKAAKK